MNDFDLQELTLPIQPQFDVTPTVLIPALGSPFEPAPMAPPESLQGLAQTTIESLLKHQVDSHSVFSHVQLLAQYQQHLMLTLSHSNNQVSYDPLKKSHSLKRPSGSAVSNPRVISRHAPPGVELYNVTYSSNPVLELVLGDTSVMRRKADGWVNATHIMRLSGIEKGKRTKTLEEKVSTLEHQRVQGGYGKFQGTWVPKEIARQIAADYNLAERLAPLLDAPLSFQSVPKESIRKESIPT